MKNKIIEETTHYTLINKDNEAQTKQILIDYLKEWGIYKGAMKRNKWDKSYPDPNSFAHGSAFHGAMERSGVLNNLYKTHIRKYDALTITDIKKKGLKGLPEYWKLVNGKGEVLHNSNDLILAIREFKHNKNIIQNILGVII